MKAFRYNGGKHGIKTEVDIPVVEIVRKYSSGSMDVEVRGGIQIHVFNKLPFVRNVIGNEDWFKNPLYSLS